MASYTHTSLLAYLGIHLLHIPWHLHSFVHFYVYSDLIPTSSHDRWLMPTHLNTPIKSSLDLWLIPNRFVHERMYSSLLDLAAHDLRLMPTHTRSRVLISSRSCYAWLLRDSFPFVPRLSIVPLDSYLFVSRPISQLVPRSIPFVYRSIYQLIKIYVYS